jgi:uncharacterized protein (TIGR00251 family)
VQFTAPTRDRAGGGRCRLRVRVAPGARRAEIAGRLGDAWKLRVRAAPERGRANDDVVALLADALGMAPSDVRIVAGHASRDKVVELDGVSPTEAERRLASFAGAS